MTGVVPINFPVFGFLSLFDLPQYLGLLLVRLAAARGDWLRQMPYSMGRRMFLVALVASATLLPLSIIGTEVNSLGWGTLLGYGSLSSAFYAVWDSTFAVGACIFAVGLFRWHFREKGETVELPLAEFVCGLRYASADDCRRGGLPPSAGSPGIAVEVRARRRHRGTLGVAHRIPRP